MRGRDIVEIARRWLGTPWVHHQKTKGVGVDCVQLVAEVAREAGFDVGEPENYYRVPEGDSLKRRLSELLIPIEATEMQVGDVWLFRLGGVPTHVGLKTDIGVLHADMRAGRVVETSLGYWSKLIAGTFRIPGVEE